MNAEGNTDASVTGQVNRHSDYSLSLEKGAGVSLLLPEKGLDHS